MVQKCDNSRHKPFFWAAGRRPADADGLFGASAPPGGHDWLLPAWPGLCLKALYSLAATVGSPLLAVPGCSATCPTHVHAPAGRPNAKKKKFKKITLLGWDEKKALQKDLRWASYSQKMKRYYMKKTRSSHGLYQITPIEKIILFITMLARPQGKLHTTSSIASVGKALCLLAVKCLEEKPLPFHVRNASSYSSSCQRSRRLHHSGAPLE